jgi:hypothetical protein
MRDFATGLAGEVGARLDRVPRLMPVQAARWATDESTCTPEILTRVVGRR